MLRTTDNYDLTGRNTFGMKVRCSRFIEYDSAQDLMDLCSDGIPAPVLHMGGGSNLLFKGDYPGTILHSNIRYCRTAASNGDNVLVEVGGGVVFDDFCAWAADKGIWGIENLSGIPGEVGASAVQNIGAYGVEVADVISQVMCFDLVKQDKVIFSCAECRYGYRDSMFKDPQVKGRYAVLSVLFHLTREYSPKLSYGGIMAALPQKESYTPGDVRATVLKIRAAKLPDPSVTGSAGSFFKNPIVSMDEYSRIEMAAQGEPVPHFSAPGGMVKVPAAWMIEKCGFKGLVAGNAAVYDKQPLVIVNHTGNASPEEIIALEERIIAGVEERFGITLHPEVEHIESK